jgi:hypothetical protein
MIGGYARVSTQDQNPELQLDALEKAGAEQTFQEKFHGSLRERHQLSQCLRTLRAGVCIGYVEVGSPCSVAKRPGGDCSEPSRSWGRLQVLNLIH